MKILLFHVRIATNHANLKIFNENKKNHENNRIPHEKQENNENHIISLDHREIMKNLKFQM